MEKLHPKAVWLFFWQLLLIGGLCILLPFLFIIVGALSALYEEGQVGLPWIVGVTRSPWGWVIFILLLYVAFCYIWAKWSYRFWRYQLDKNAIKIEKGVIWKKYVSIPYERVQNVDIYRGVFARILGLSDLQIQTAGYSGYGQYGRGTEGRLPGLGIQVAEKLRDELIKKVKGTEQGL